MGMLWGKHNYWGEVTVKGSIAVIVCASCLIGALSSCQTTGPVIEAVEETVTATITPEVPKLIDYSEFPGVLDFEAYSGIPLKTTNPSSRGTSFTYTSVNPSIIESYINSLIDNGFKLEEETNSNAITLKTNEYKVQIVDGDPLLTTRTWWENYCFAMMELAKRAGI